MKQEDETLTKIVEEARKDKDVLAVMLFGSYIRKKTKPKDIDVCIVLNSKKDDLFMSNKKLEYLKLCPEKYDIQIFQQLPVFIRMRILKEGEFLLSKDNKLMTKIALSTFKEFDLFKRHYYFCIKEIAYGR